jgi:hypothetical protein
MNVKYKMDILNFMLWIYKILPFILVSYFIISSLLGNDFSGFLVFLGILLSSFVTFIVGEIPFIRTMLENSLGKPSDPNYVNKINEYKILKFGESGNPYTLFPLGTNTFSFILGYFLMVLSMSGRKSSNQFSENWILISVLSALLAFDVSTNFKYIGGLVIFPVGIGMIMGAIWAIMIGKKNHMIPKKATTKCSMNASKKYKCVLNKNGTILK